MRNSNRQSNPAPQNVSIDQPYNVPNNAPAPVAPPEAEDLFAAANAGNVNQLRSLLSQAKWEKWDILHGESVNFQHNGLLVSGTVADIDENGRLGILDALDAGNSQLKWALLSESLSDAEGKTELSKQHSQSHQLALPIEGL
ncbi:hypothetical protein GQR58_023549 [Nymphon striatum]|nr:hypothetical protein GQR58_023549 [Nymphon striatum]